jgi:hypothetical protein
VTTGAGVTTVAGAGETTAGVTVQPASTATTAAQNAIGMKREEVRMTISLNLNELRQPVWARPSCIHLRSAGAWQGAGNAADACRNLLVRL